MRRRPGWLAPLTFAVAVLLVGCDATATTGPTPSRSAAPGATPATTASEPEPTATGTPPTEPPSCARATLDRMTLRQRVGQLFMVKLPTLAAGASISGAITTWHIGNVWIGRQTAGVTAIRAVTDALQHLTRDTATGGVPLFVSANQEGGSIQGLSGPGFATIPSAVTQGSWSVAKLETQAAVWGGDLAEAGVNADFAPVADVVPDGTQSQNAPIGQLRREYGTEPGPVADHVVAFIDGLHDAGVATTVKHFPGLGRVEGNTDNVADVVDDVTTRDDAYLEPFQAAIADGSTEFAMISLATYTRIDPDHLAVFSPTVMRDMLRGELGFDGVIMSDSLTATAVVSIAAGTRAIRFLEAGGDLVVLTPVDTAVAMVKAVVARATSNATFRSLVDASALRVLEAKAKAGLLSCG